MPKIKCSGAVCSKIALIGIITGILVIISGCISWNVHTTLESHFLPDGTLERRGIISVRQFDTDSNDNRYPVVLDTPEAKTYINKNYIPPAGAAFEGYNEGPDSSLSVSWSLKIDNPEDGFLDYKRLTADSSAFSGNRIEAIKTESFFRTEYEYREVFFDAVTADSVIAYLPAILPLAENAFFDYLKRYSKSRSAQTAVNKSSEEITVVLADYWDDLVRRFLFDPSITEGNESLLDSLREATAAVLLSLLTAHPGGSGFTDEIINDALEAGESEIDKRLREKGIYILGAYTTFSDDNYLFTLKLNIPGRIEATNADSVSNNYLEWKFTNNEFRTKELLLYARSSEYHWINLIIAIIAVFLIIALITFAVKRITAPKTPAI